MCSCSFIKFKRQRGNQYYCRHGKGHKINPTEVNYRANIRAMEKLGVTHILASTACGSLRENYKPGDFVILDSFIDR